VLAPLNRARSGPPFDPADRPMRTIFVGGTGRSGTTITSGLLGRHPAWKRLHTEVKFISNHGGLSDLVEGRTTRGSVKVMEIARASDDLNARLYAIRFIGELKDPASLDELIRIYDADKTKEVRSQTLRALSEREDPRARAKGLDIARTGETPELRIEAIRRLGNSNRVGIDDLLQLYSSETNLQIKQGLLRAFAESDDPRVHAKILEIARGNDPIELRGYALRALAQRADEQTIDQLVAMYDSEQNQQLKAMLVRAFGESQHKSAVRKLMAIARNDQSVELRKMAVRYLGQSRDPEAMKFLEDLLK
jgi:HEAT repeat protein